MRTARVVPALLALALVGVGFVACGGKVSIEDEGDAGVDASPTTKPTTTPTTTATPTPTPTTTGSPPSCPTYRPLRGTPCFTGLSCFYPCAPGTRTSIHATCPGGSWTIAEVEACAPTPPRDCDTCQKERCAAELAACRRTDAVFSACNSLIMCINGCFGSAPCQNKCVVDSMSSEGKDLLSCWVDKCPDACL